MEGKIFKNIPFEFATNKVLKSDDDKWVIEGYASTDDLDRQNEIVSREALQKAEKDLMENNVVFYEHKHDELPIGKVIEATLDDKGLRIKIQISKTAEKIWQLIKEGVLHCFSIGGRVVKAVELYLKEQDKKVVEIQEIELLEVSLVGIPANPEARAIGWYISKALNGGVEKQMDNKVLTSEKIPELVKPVEEEKVEEKKPEEVVEKKEESEEEEPKEKEKQEEVCPVCQTPLVDGKCPKCEKKEEPKQEEKSKEEKEEKAEPKEEEYEDGCKAKEDYYVYYYEDYGKKKADKSKYYYYYYEKDGKRVRGSRPYYQEVDEEKKEPYEDYYKRIEELVAGLSAKLDGVQDMLKELGSKLTIKQEEPKEESKKPVEPEVVVAVELPKEEAVKKVETTVEKQELVPESKAIVISSPYENPVGVKKGPTEEGWMKFVWKK